MNQPRTTKAEARDLAKQALAQLTDAQRAAASQAICDRAAQLDHFAAAQSLFLYYPVPPEADLLPLAQAALAQGKQIAFPRINWADKTMAAAPVPSLDAANFVTRRHAIPEPTADQSITPSLIIVPALAFDPEGRRLGRGGGFYDRYLAAHPAIPRIGVCFDRQILPQIPTDAHDVPMHAVITESRTLIPTAD